MKPQEFIEACRAAGLVGFVNLYNTTTDGKTNLGIRVSDSEIEYRDTILCEWTTPIAEDALIDTNLDAAWTYVQWFYAGGAKNRFGKARKP